MADLDLVWKELISRLNQAKESVPGKATALCPAHNDKNPSLSVKLTDQKILLNCHAGCSFKAIVSALNMNINQFNTKISNPKREDKKFADMIIVLKMANCSIRSCDIILKIFGHAVQTANTL